jgi:amino acid transporter
VSRVVAHTRATANKEEIGMNIKHVVFGKPFPTSAAQHERLDNVRGLAVFASDPISSNAYATEAIMHTLLLLGTAALSLTLPIALVIALLVLLVILSYNQTIAHYPMGGGAYMVAKDNLGTIPSLLAAAALLSDYVLTVAVSVSAGVKALASAFPDVPLLHEHRIVVGIGIIIVITWINLRGVRESGTIFAIPTYAFVLGVLVVIGMGLAREFGLYGAPLAAPPVTAEAAPSLSSLAILWVVLRAFAAGCTALTGIEAISNGVQAFRQPAPRNAITTMRVMGGLAMVLFIGISFLAVRVHIIPTETESVLSQMTRLITGTGPLYYWVQTFTMLILVLAANTAYQDFPRLAAIIARDRFLPRWMTLLGDRLVYSMGIGLLALLASVVLGLFDGDEIRLLPLYAIGVFTSFTLSQFGMVRLWRRVSRLAPGETLHTGETTLHHEAGWRWKSLPSLIGCVVTGIVLVILSVTKFVEGAWMILLVMPLLVGLFLLIRRHYDHVAKNLSLEGVDPTQVRSPAEVAIVPIGGVHRASLRAIKYAHRFASDVRVIHVVSSPEEETAIRKKWAAWQSVLGDATLIFLPSDYREIISPIVDYIDHVNHREFPGQLVTVVIPEFMPDQRAAMILHNQTAAQLLVRLRRFEDVIVIDVPYHLRRDPVHP